MGFMKPPRPPKPKPPIRDETVVAETEVDTDGISTARRRMPKGGGSRARLRIPLQGGGLNTPGS